MVRSNLRFACGTRGTVRTHQHHLEQRPYQTFLSCQNIHSTSVFIKADILIRADPLSFKMTGLLGCTYIRSMDYRPGLSSNRHFRPSTPSLYAQVTASIDRIRLLSYHSDADLGHHPVYTPRQLQISDRKARLSLGFDSPCLPFRALWPLAVDRSTVTHLYQADQQPTERDLDFQASPRYAYIRL